MPSKAPTSVIRCRTKFLRHFPKGFRDETYLDWERTYKWNAHLEELSCMAAAAIKRASNVGATWSARCRASRLAS